MLDPHTVEVSGRRYEAERILIATGGTPIMPKIPGREHAHSSDAVFGLDQLPERVMIVGAGYVALELGSVFLALGVEVTLIHRGEEILRGFDRDLRCHLHDELEAKGMRILLNKQVSALREASHGFEAELDDGSTVTTDLPLFAIGRRPNIAALGLDELGVELGPWGGIVVDENFTSSVPSIHAVGDVANRLQLTPVAIAARHAFRPSLLRSR